MAEQRAPPYGTYAPLVTEPRAAGVPHTGRALDRNNNKGIAHERFRQTNGDYGKKETNTTLSLMPYENPHTKSWEPSNNCVRFKYLKP